MKILKAARAVLLGAACLVTLAAAAVVFGNWRAERAWREYIVQRESLGDFVLKAPPIAPAPGDTNNFMSARPLEPWLNAPTESAEMKAFLASLPTQRYLPQSDWKSGARFDFTAARWVKSGVATASGQSEAEQAAAILRALDPTRPILESLRAAALQRPKSYIARNPFAPAANPPQLRYRYVREICQLVALDGCASLKVGQIDNAYADALALLKLSAGFRSSPRSLLEPFISQAALNYALLIFWEGWRDQAWSDAQLDVFKIHLGSTQHLRSLARGLQAVRYEAANDYTRPPTRWMLEQHGPVSRLPFWALYNLVNFCREIDIIATAVEHGGEDLRQAISRNLAQHARVYRPIEKRSGNAVIFVQGHPSRWSDHYLSELYLFPSLLTQAVRTDAYAVEAMTVCALEQYRAIHGVYPSQLEELLPQQLSSLPEDAMSNQPLHYKRTSDNNFLLYSVGPDGRDDGGHHPDLPIPGSGEFKPGTDIVWPTHSLVPRS